MSEYTCADSTALAGRPELALASPYLTTPEAATYLRTTSQGIYSLVKRRRLKTMPGRPGRLLFTREALDRYLSSRKR
ncbi:MAG TPA: helix-turn-helix domain-containing protein [Gemmataceae bacterium]|jgi:excisionase family DNA binding protein|nr:helix-turn-helix domain-containing protein [Gemmataceae bacterium]